MSSWVLRDYVCAVCWQALVERYRDGEWRIECGSYGVEHAGFHRWDTAAHGRIQGIADLYEFKSLYRESEFAEMLKLIDHRTPEEILAYGRVMLGRDEGGIF